MKELTKYKTYEHSSFIEIISKFLIGVEKEDYPSVGVVGIAGAVSDNKVYSVNISWDVLDGYQIA